MAKNSRILKILLKNGADIDLTDNHRKSTLSYLVDNFGNEVSSTIKEAIREINDPHITSAVKDAMHSYNENLYEDKLMKLTIAVTKGRLESIANICSDISEIEDGKYIDQAIAEIEDMADEETMDLIKNSFSISDESSESEEYGRSVASSSFDLTDIESFFSDGTIPFSDDGDSLRNSSAFSFASSEGFLSPIKQNTADKHDLTLSSELREEIKPIIKTLGIKADSNSDNKIKFSPKKSQINKY